MPSTGVGVPIKLFHECIGHKITVELNNGDLYRGLMRVGEDSMNCQLQSVTYISGVNSEQSKLEYVFIRGSKIRLIILPDMLRNAPLFKKFLEKRAKTSSNTTNSSKKKNIKSNPSSTNKDKSNKTNTNTKNNKRKAPSNKGSR